MGRLSSFRWLGNSVTLYCTGDVRATILNHAVWRCYDRGSWSVELSVGGVTCLVTATEFDPSPARKRAREGYMPLRDNSTPLIHDTVQVKGIRQTEQT